MKKNTYLKLLGATAVLCLCLTTLAGPTLQNGDFSSPVDVGWTDYAVTSIDAGVAVLAEDPVLVAYLEQEFTIPALTVSLSFEYKPLFEIEGVESFVAYLLEPDWPYDPLIPTDADPSWPSAPYYFMHDWNYFLGIDEVLTDPAYVTVTPLGQGWSRVSLDLTGLGGAETDALLAFELNPNFYDDASYDGQIRLDNVNIAVIPAPGALLLGLIGFGTAGLWRRLAKIQ